MIIGILIFSTSLTMSSTVAGLLPLAFSSSTLWPPLACAMISGIFASTFLTLMVTPALYTILFTKGRRRIPSIPKTLKSAAASILILLLLSPELNAEPLYLSLKEVMIKAKDRPSQKASLYEAEASEKALEAEKRAAYFPVVSSQAAYTVRDRDVSMITDVPGLGTFSSSIGENKHYSAGVMIIQPIIDPQKLFYTIPAATDETRAKDLIASRNAQELSAEAARIYLNLLSIDAQIATTAAYVASLKARLGEMEKMVDVGRVLEADLLKGC